MAMLLPFDSPAAESQPTYEPLSESEIQDLTGVYTNHRQTIELRLSDGRLVATRRGGDDSEGAGAARIVEKQDASRLSLQPSRDASGARSSYYMVRRADGKPEYLISSGRAFRRAR
jgi:hypothetical protein